MNHANKELDFSEAEWRLLDFPPGRRAPLPEFLASRLIRRVVDLSLQFEAAAASSALSDPLVCDQLNGQYGNFRALYGDLITVRDRLATHKSVDD